MKMDKVAIIERFKTVKKIEKDNDLAQFLGVKGSTICNWRTRNSLDYDILFTNCKDVNLNWLIYGEGDMLRSSGNAVVQGNSGNVCQGGVRSVVSGAGEMKVDMPVGIIDLLASQQETIKKLTSVIEKLSTK